MILSKGSIIDIGGKSELAGKKAKVVKYSPARRAYLCMLRMPGGRRERIYIPAHELTYHEAK